MYIHSNNETVERINVSEIASTSALADYSTAAVIRRKYKGLSLREIVAVLIAYNLITMTRYLSAAAVTKPETFDIFKLLLTTRRRLGYSQRKKL